MRLMGEKISNPEKYRDEEPKQEVVQGLLELTLTLVRDDSSDLKLW